MNKSHHDFVKVQTPKCTMVFIFQQNLNLSASNFYGYLGTKQYEIIPWILLNKILL